MTPRSVLDVVASACLIFASCVLTYMAVGRVRPSASTPPLACREGERFAQTRGLDFSAAPKTLLLWVSTGCRYCTESLPFYAALFQDHGSTQVVLLGAEAEAVLRRYAQRYSLSPSAIVSAPASAVRLTGTPTMVLVDATGIVRRIWKGKLSQDGEEQVLLAIGQTRQAKGGRSNGG